ncbi:MAG: SDR family NAD(P)-dependent oxidoreductase [Pseudomonadales bacterium]|nr:SDR family NAD(P)-dependent oxidoreductase [Pseudomonadales bacterium]
MFSRRDTAEKVTEGIDLTGKTIAITGVNSGLGYESMRVLAARGAHVIGLARSLEKAQKACSSVEGETTPFACELSDLNSVKECANQINELKSPIDVLICNAGIMALPDLTVKDGLEMQFLTNHMGHFLLVYLIQEKLKQASEGRIVMLSSAAHQLTVKGGINFNNLDGSKGYSSWKFYGQSKLANLLTAKAFDQRLQSFGVRANAIHPGVINTNLSRNLDGVFGSLLKLPFADYLMNNVFGKTIPQGSSTQCYVATNPELSNVGGKYFADNNEEKTSYYGGHLPLADKLWDFSLQYLQPYLADVTLESEETEQEAT